MPTIPGRTQIEAAAILGISTASLRRYIADGTLDEPPRVKFGKGMRKVYDDAWLEKAKIKIEAERQKKS